jgi:hypothetical protein
MADIHHMALHISSTTKKNTKGMPLYKVHNVGSSLADRIKPGEHLSDSELDDAQEMGVKIKHIKEGKTLQDIIEGRGRPRKAGGPTDRKEAAAKTKKKDDDDEGDDFGPDVGPEADQNITVHLKKTMDNEKHVTNFSDGSKHVVPQHVAKTVHDGMMSLKPEQRMQVQDHIQKSHKNLMDVHTMLKGR